MSGLPKMPYLGTEIPAEKTQMDITLLLKRYGVKDIQWTELKGKLSLKFIHSWVFEGVAKEVMFEFTPPDIRVERRSWNSRLSRYEKQKVPHQAAAMRLLYWYLEGKLKAVTWGLETMEMEMATHVLLNLPDGTAITVGEVLKKRLDRGALEGVEKLALEEKLTTPEASQ